jgi:hypothetical protein
MFRSGVMVVLVAFVVSSASVRADLVTGDPSVDAGWQRVGNSLQAGVYIRGGANFSFDVYRWAHTVTTGDQFNTQLGWAAGNTVLGLGGVVVNTVPSGWAIPTTGGPVNGELTDSVRFVSKFGSPLSTFSTSTTPPAAGNGNGSFSGGDGGLGGVMLSTAAGTLARANAANANSLRVPDLGWLWEGGIAGPNGQTFTTAEMTEFSRYIYNTDANGTLSSYEMVLNTTRLDQFNGAFLLPTAESPNDQAMQRGTSNVITDAFAPGIAAIPAPPSLVLGLLALVAVRRRKQ